ncbi:MAG: DUF2382 domain-containing protein [Thermoproteota archaeon]|nr:DUF2382 domain-containing protein [Thermoproteota archaeon]
MSSDIDWHETMKKEARGINDEHLGEVQEVTNEHVLTQRGIIDKEKFYIPRDKVESFDGAVLRFNISEEEVLDKYIKDKHAPSIEEQYASTTSIDSGGGSGGGIHIEENTREDDSTITNSEQMIETPKDTGANEPTLSKESVKETKTVEVPIKREEIEIEIRPPSGQTEAQEPVSDKESITIPLKKEEVEVKKKVYVKEEIDTEK